MAKRLRSLVAVHAGSVAQDGLLGVLTAILPFGAGIVPIVPLPGPADGHAAEEVGHRHAATVGPAIAGGLGDCDVVSTDPGRADSGDTELFDWDPDATPPQPMDDYDGCVDIVNLYLKQAGRTPLLAADEEVELARRIEVGVLAKERLGQQVDEPAVREDLAKLIRRGAEARERLTIANLRLVISIARRNQGRGLDLLDLIQFGNLGLIQAVNKFDFQKGFKFSTYASWWIRQQIDRGIADTAPLVRIPVHLVEKLNKMMTCLHTAESELGRRPSVEELADRSGKTTAEVYQLMDTAIVPISLNSMVEDEGDTELGSFVGVSDTGLAEFESEMSRPSALYRLFGILTEKEARIIRLRFGFEDGEQHTLEEIGREFGVTRERIRQLERKAMEKFCEHLDVVEEVRLDL